MTYLIGWKPLKKPWLRVGERTFYGAIKNPALGYGVLPFVIDTDRFQKLQISSIEELRSWLKENHAQSESIWLITFKNSEKEKYVDRWSVLDELICFGWTDGIRRKLDETRTMQLISPRRVEHWSKTYKDRATRLIKEGRMHKAGLDSIEASKKSGLWDFMDDIDKLIIPKDLKGALEKKPNALSFFLALNDSSKRFALRWLKLSKTEKTRNSRIEKLVHLSNQGEKLPGS